MRATETAERTWERIELGREVLAAEMVVQFNVYSLQTLA
jgi:hypothetical protein